MRYLRSLAAICLLVVSAVDILSQGGTGTGAVSLPGLASPVSVRRDARSIPYIDAANDADLYFVQGYVTASDRLWQMDIMRRRALGETAEIFGALALEDDKVWRRYGFRQIAEDNLKYLSPDLAHRAGSIRGRCERIHLDADRRIDAGRVQDPTIPASRMASRRHDRDR